MTRLQHSSVPTVSPWLARHAPRLRAASSVLDLACGNGRHTRYLVSLGHRLTAVDIDLAGVRGLRGARLLQHDLEGDRWPFQAGEFGGIVVTNYLHRPLFPVLADSLAPGGLLLIDTFMRGHERYGRPRNPDFLLRPGELRASFGGLLRELAYEEVLERHPRVALRQRALLRKPGD